MAVAAPAPAVARAGALAVVLPAVPLPPFRRWHSAALCGPPHTKHRMMPRPWPPLPLAGGLEGCRGSCELPRIARALRTASRAAARVRPFCAAAA
eukprot:3698908-Lingulodinium_polyedra.AAC.1